MENTFFNAICGHLYKASFFHLTSNGLMEYMSPVSQVYQSKIDRVKIQRNKNLSSILLHNKFGHRNKRTLTLASSIKNFLW